MIGEKMRAAVERRKAKIAKIGYPAYRAEMDEKKRMIIEQSQQQARAQYAQGLLERSGLGVKFFTRTFKAFTATKGNMEAYSVCVQIADGQRKKGVILSGPHGIGKTHLAAAVVIHMAAKGALVYFRNIVDLVDEVKDSFKTGTERVIDKVLEASVIVLDDVGAEHTKTDSGFIDSLLYKIVNRAYEGNKILIMTTNLDEFDFAKRYNTRIISRLHEMCDSICYTEKDARLDMVPTDEQMPFDTP
jgi:DNA replication protein DnaC